MYSYLMDKEVMFYTVLVYLLLSLYSLFKSSPHIFVKLYVLGLCQTKKPSIFGETWVKLWIKKSEFFKDPIFNFQKVWLLWTLIRNI